MNVESVRYTDDIKKYNTQEYLAPKTVFPTKIPSSAMVVSYSHFSFWNEAEDIYLELKFKSAKEMESYLTDLRRACTTICKKNKSDENVFFIETDNIYNKSYKGLFCTIYRSSQYEIDYTGYKIVKEDADVMRYQCNFGLISYSVEQLTVIHTYVYGWYRSNVHEHIPQYFKRFNVPTQEDHNRVIILPDT